MNKKVTSKKVTVVLSDDIIKKLRKKQAELIKKSQNSVSFSMVVNKILRENINEI